jgi:hypothetical protein
MNPALMPLLTFAVVEDLAEVRRLSDRELRKTATATADVLCASLDVIVRDAPLRTRAEREEFRSLWAALVRGIAIAALQPGGTTILGQHFDATKWPFSAGRQ